jgi:hypothetical protein
LPATQNAMDLLSGDQNGFKGLSFRDVPRSLEGHRSKLPK